MGVIFLITLIALPAVAQSSIFSVQDSPSPNPHGNTLNAVAQQLNGAFALPGVCVDSGRLLSVWHRPGNGLIVCAWHAGHIYVWWLSLEVGVVASNLLMPFRVER
jgi:hypothetical protein